MVKKNKKQESEKNSLKQIMKKIQQQFGAESIMLMENKDHTSKIPVIPSGSITLDKATGVNGFPRGRIIELYGPESSGKTTLALAAIASVQKIGGVAAYIDVENAIDKKYAEVIGVDWSRVLFSQPNCGEDALGIAEMLSKENTIDLIVIDSVAALVPKAELEGSMQDKQMGEQARMMGKGIRKLLSKVNKSKTVVLFINQIREKIGVMFGNPETTPGGRALKFAASMRLNIKRIGYVKGHDQKPIASQTHVKIVKNKLAAPFKEATFNIVYGKGIDYFGEIFDLALKEGKITKTGSWYSIGDIHIGQGRENAVAYIKENIDKLSDVVKEYDHYGYLK